MNICAVITERNVVRFWIPLSSTWLMMAMEGPILAALVARLADPTVNLAAYGVAAAIAMLIESPVIALLSASVALSRDDHSRSLLHRFMVRLNWLVTVLMIGICIPPVFDLVALNIIGLPSEVAWRVHVGLLCMIPWPAAIGVRRFYQGLLIRRGLTRSVAIGTIARLLSMAASGLLLSAYGVEGVVVGCVGLTAGVVLEGTAIWLIARRQPDAEDEGASEPLTDRRIIQFYAPLALTSVVSFFATPLLSFFVNRMPMAVESLAVIPVVSSLLFVFRSFGFSYQEVGITFLGMSPAHYRVVRRVGVWITLATSVLMIIVVATPLLSLTYTYVFALEPNLVQLAILPTQLLIIVPVTAAMYSLQRSVMIATHQTIHVSVSMAIEVGTMALCMTVFTVLGTVHGALAASIAIGIGSVLSSLYAYVISRRLRQGW